MSLKNRDHQKYLIKNVRDILLDHWDPLGIGTNINLADEYDSFLGPIIQILQQQDTRIDVLQDYLKSVEAELHSPISDEARSKTASALWKLRQQ